MDTRKLVYMANQIATFFAPKGEEAVVAGVSDHIRKFWDPRMRASILTHLDQGGDGLAPLVARAIARLRDPAQPKEP